MLEVPDGIRGHAFFILLLNFDLLDGDQGLGIIPKVAKIDIGIGTFTELLACFLLKFNLKCGETCVLPLIYLCFSSSFICSARSRPMPLLGDAVLGLVPFEVTTLADGLDLLVGPFLSAKAGGTIKGETAICYGSHKPTLLFYPHTVQ